LSELAQADLVSVAVAVDHSLTHEGDDLVDEVDPGAARGGLEGPGDDRGGQDLPLAGQRLGAHEPAFGFDGAVLSRGVVLESSRCSAARTNRSSRPEFVHIADHLLSLGNAPSHSLVDIGEGSPYRRGRGRMVEIGAEADRRGHRAGPVRGGLIHRRTPPGFRRGRASGTRSRSRAYRLAAVLSPPTLMVAVSPLNMIAPS